MKTFRDLLIWQKAMTLVTKCYAVSSDFPKEEQFGLTSQIRRCSISIPSNISEGYGRGTNKDYHRFLKISLGSLFEFQTQIEIAYNLNYITEENFKNLHEDSRELERMLTSFINKVQETL
jgi:four helix bundle protein